MFGRIKPLADLLTASRALLSVYLLHRGNGQHTSNAHNSRV